MPTDVKYLQKVQDLSDGALITNEVDGTGYLFRNGVLTAVASPTEALVAGIRPDQADRFLARPEQIDTLMQQRQQQAYIGVVNEALTGSKTFDSGDVFLGAGHFMRTWGAINLASGAIAAQTRTRTVTWFGGYHGAARVIIADVNDAPIYQSQDHRYGVDGTWVGTSDRTDAWYENLDQNLTSLVRRVYIFQSWAPDDFVTVLNKWAAAAAPVAALAGDVASVAKVVALAV